MNLTQKITSYETQVNQFNTTISQLNTTINNYELKITQYNTTINNYETKITQLNTTIHNYQTAPPPPPLPAPTTGIDKEAYEALVLENGKKTLQTIFLMEEIYRLNLLYQEFREHLMKA